MFKKYLIKKMLPNLAKLSLRQDDTGPRFQYNAADMVYWNGKFRIQDFTNKNQCPICHESLIDTEITVLEDCGHSFHTQCISAWINNQIQNQRQPVCALCNTPVMHWPLPHHDIPTNPVDEWFFSTAYGDTGTLGVKLNQGFDINTRDGEREFTALILAAHQQNFDSVRFLLEHGADDSLQDIFGDTALIHACRTGNIHIARFMLTHNQNLDVNVFSNSGSTALYWASSTGMLEIVQMLLQRGGAQQVNLVHISDHTPFLIAILNGREDVALALLETGQVDLNILFNNEYLAFHAALRRLSVQFVQRMIEFGQDPHAKIADGRTALIIACTARRSDLALFLLNNVAGWDIFAHGNNGRSAYDLALENDMDEVVGRMQEMYEIDVDLEIESDEEEALNEVLTFIQ